MYFRDVFSVFRMRTDVESVGIVAWLSANGVCTDPTGKVGMVTGARVCFQPHIAE
jgi:hypothetical protein